MQTSYLTPEICRTAQLIQKREMTLPVLLFLTAHRPLAFVAGQFLHVASPLAHLGGWQQCADWANLLSSPTGVRQLERLLQIAKPSQGRL